MHMHQIQKDRKIIRLSNLLTVLRMSGGGLYRIVFLISCGKYFSILGASVKVI